MRALKTGKLVRCLLIPLTIAFATMIIGSCGGGGSSSSSSPGNVAPTVSAGPDMAVTLPATAMLNGTVTDDGLPNPPGSVTAVWSKFTGPGTVTFSPNAVDTEATFSEPGTYVLRLIANDGDLDGGDEVTITVSPVQIANKAPTVNAGPDQEVALSGAASLNGTVTDDGLPFPPGAVTTTWSVDSGPGTVTFANVNAVATTATFNGAGDYVLRLTANDGGLAASDNLTITVINLQTPNISLLPAQTDFGVVVLGKSADRNIQIRNTGNADLNITDITSPVDPFTIITDNCTGAVISTSSSCGLTIRFAPATQADFPDNVDITSNDPAGLVTATLTGKGRALNTSIKSVDLVGPNTVQVVVSVTDRFDVPVTTLAAGNFSISENGSPINIDSVSNTIIPSVSVGMVVDISSSLFPYATQVKTAAKSFVDQLDPGNGDEANVIKFAQGIQVMQPYTSNQILLKDAIDRFIDLGNSGTFLTDALWESITYTAQRTNPRKAIVAVSDGELYGNYTRTIEEVTARAASNNIQIYTIGIGVPVDAVLQQLATDTGGQYFPNPNADDLTNIYSTISEILLNEYTIVYTTSSAAGDTISITVMVDDNGPSPGGQLGEYSVTDTL